MDTSSHNPNECACDSCVYWMSWREHITALEEAVEALAQALDHNPGDPPREAFSALQDEVSRIRRTRQM